MSTLVDFLQKRGHVVENNPNTKITEQEYELLVKEFSLDMSLKQEAERLVQERTNRDKQKVETSPAAPVVAPAEEVKPVAPPVVEEEVINLRPQIKHVGKIDLDALNRKHKPEEKAIPEPKPEVTLSDQKKPVTETPVVEEVVEKQPSPKIPPVVSEEQPSKPEIKPEIKPELLPETKPEPARPSEPVSPAQPVEPEKIVEQPVVEAHKPVKVPTTPKPSLVKVSEKIEHKEPAEPVQKVHKIEHKKKIEPVVKTEPQEEKATREEPELFKLGVQRLESNIKVIKTIDLDALNQSTRPKKKSQAEKRKEREEKIQSDRVQRATHPSEVKSPVRTGTQTSTIARPIIGGGDKSESGASAEAIKKKKRNRIKDGKVRVNDAQPGVNNPRPAQAPQEIKSRLKKPVLKSEISTEDVSKQVKETLARLTSKPKKGTKYRKEKREAGSQRRIEDAERELQESAVIKITEFVTVNDLANMMDIPVVKVIST
ncbi:MAG: translation initiation factor IF-2, partial [Bacteroidales bacterium]|nr:translation initiation factor IF-2 [Bacteroidales bacterium]